MAKIKKVDITPTYYRVRFRDPRTAKTCRVPKWATHAANFVSKGAKVVTCKSKATKKWKIQSVMIKKQGKSLTKSKSLARKIVKMIEK